MAHVRQQVREAVKAALLGLPTTGVRVYSARPYQLDPEANELPGWVVATPRESSEAVSGHGGNVILDRIITLRLVGYAQGREVEDVLDAMSVEVEAAIAAAFPIGGDQAPIQQILPVSAEVEIDEGRGRLGAIVLEFQVRTRTTAADPETVI